MSERATSVDRAAAKLHPISIFPTSIGGHCLHEPQRLLLKLLICGKCDLRPLLNWCLEL